MKNFMNITTLPNLPLYKTLCDMLDKGILNWGVHNQICINSTPDQTHNFFYGCASLEYDWDNAVFLPNGNIQVSKRSDILAESDFTDLCDVFKGTNFEIIYKELEKKFKIGRVRLMASKPKTCLTWHNDSSKRLHYPLKTQEGCFMVIENEVFHIPKNEWWLTDTNLPHTAFNSSKELRIHLVASIIS
jgi:hypothetical protein